ncbi:stage III sporulation protein AD [Salsuginibacillus halophilus]|uniref:Stage III sporulation protein AD n=1 Tax=Salsuginibacillus halophilus TaxID=517424 RepID=A0A2P8HAI3_9BACI|nr:stage III sporulation protein AD [Salsuginibacillus halophilus]PSL43189.1 stage III sporulation protein AD [Salsuginibacillus halophilus]
MPAEILQIVGIGLIAAFLSLIVKEHQPVFAFLLTLAVAAVLLLFLVDYIYEALYLLETIAASTDINLVYLDTVLKIIGIAYITEFGAQMTRDAGEEAIASKIELAGKVLILVISLPIFRVLVETVLSLIPA